MRNIEERDSQLKSLFKDSFDKVSVSSNMKEDMITQMKKANEEESVKVPVRMPKRKSFLVAFPAAAAIVCAAVLFLVIRPAGVPYVTQMEDGIYYDKVELKDGVINFVANRVAISISPNAGQVVIGQQEDTTEIAEEIIVEEKATKSGGTIICKKAARVSLPRIAENSWSNIGDNKIYVTVLKTDELRYQAVYEKDDEAYEVIGENVTQKEFIDYLYGEAKK